MEKFSDIHLVDKKTASGSIQFFAKYDKQQDVIAKACILFTDYKKFKRSLRSKLEKKVSKAQKSRPEIGLFFKNMDKEYEDYKMLISGLKYENKIYSEILDPLIKNGLSRNFIDFVALDHFSTEKLVSILFPNALPTKVLHSMFAGFETALSMFLLSNDGIDKDNIEIGRDGFYIPKSLLLQEILKFTKVECLIIKRITNVRTFNAFLFHESVSEEVMKQLMFQLFYTLYLMENIKLQHNDLHLDNILIEQLNSPTKLEYVVQGKNFAVNTKYLLRVFDWDRSYVYDSHFGKNEILKLSMYAQIRLDDLNRRVKYFDYFTVLCSIITTLYLYRFQHSFPFLNKKKMLSLFPKLFKSGLFYINEKGNITGYNKGENFITTDGKSCRPNKLDKLSKLDDLTDVLLTPWFQTFNTDNPPSRWQNILDFLNM